MELTILHLYPDSMSLYGEYANLALLRRRLEALGVQVNVKNITSKKIVTSRIRFLTLIPSRIIQSY